MSYTLTLTLTLAACFAAQSLALRAVGGRTAKSESNFFSSLGRIQAGAQGKPNVMILGSSITGRLPDRAQGRKGVANMGCDGGSAVDALRAMDQGILPAAPNLVIEANTLFLALNPQQTDIGKAMTQPWFKLGLRTPFIAAYARPAAFFYSKLLTKRTGSLGTHVLEDDLGVSSKPTTPTDTQSQTLTPEQNTLINEISEILGRLRKKGCHPLIVWLPPGRGVGSAPPAWILELARRSGTPWWDLGQDAKPGTVTLTDGVHMDAGSASRTLTSLLKSIPHADNKEK